MKNFCKCLAMLVLSLGLQAGTSHFTGHGTSKPRDPEFITVEISVASDCYETPSAAMKANNKVTAEIQVILESLLIKDPIDVVRIQGGMTAPSSLTVYEHNESKAVCPGTYRQNTSVTFKTANIKNFSQVFATIQEQLLDKSVKSGDESSAPRTFVSIGSPSAGVCQETSSLMALEATKNAYAHARAQFDAVASMCGIIGDVEIATFGDTQRESYPRKSYNAEAAFMPSSDVVALSFDQLSESATLSASFTYGKTVFTCNMGQ